MIYLKIRGRLGNQFFQYACVKNFQMKYYPNERIAIDFSDLKRLGSENEGFVDSLVHFKVDEYETVNSIKLNIVQKTIVFCMKLINPFLRIIGLKNKADIITYNFEKIIQPLINKFGVYYMIHGYSEFQKSKAKNKIFYGNFESSLFFNENSEYIKKMFTPKKNIIDKNKKLYEKIQNTNSVCITIRRGDFVKNNEIQKVHFVCDSSYFYKAIKTIKKLIPNPTFIVFSDDIDWVKNNMNFGSNVIYEEGNDPIWEKIRAMYSCKHFIISNSTFSWWAQYLSKNKNKIVIAPKKWKNISYKKNSGDLDIYEDYWIKI